MKKLIYTPLIALLAILLAACVPQTMLQRTTGANRKQSQVIEEHLSEAGVTYKTIATSTNPITEGMDESWTAYDLADGEGNAYVLLLRKADQDFTAILDQDGRMLNGIIDNALLPALYEWKDGGYEYKFDPPFRMSTSADYQIVLDMVNEEYGTQLTFDDLNAPTSGMSLEEYKEWAAAWAQDELQGQ